MIKDRIGIKKWYIRALCALGLIVANSLGQSLGLAANALEMTSARPLVNARVEKDAIEKVSTNSAQPTEVTDTMEYRVQDGGNYLLFRQGYMPATIAYIPDSPFGSIPKAIRGQNEELTCTAGFRDCQQGWIWQLEKADQDWLITIEAHEDATIWVMPTKSEEPPVDECEGKKVEKTVEEEADCKYEFGDKVLTEGGTYQHTFTTVEGCDSIVTLILTINTEGCEQVDPCEGKTKTTPIEETICEGAEYNFNGKILTKRGIYSDTLKTVEGCDSIVTLDLKVKNCGDMQTVYFCKGMNTEHQEGGYWYKQYEYESPAKWFKLSDYQKGGERDRTLMDLRQAEADLRGHYAEETGLTPVEQIIWSHRNEAATIYSTVEAANEAQWIEAGVLAVRVLFLCGESYSTDFTTDVVNVNAAQQPVKMIENGQVVIIRGGDKYNILGTRLR